MTPMAMIKCALTTCALKLSLKTARMKIWVIAISRAASSSSHPRNCLSLLGARVTSVNLLSDRVTRHRIDLSQWGRRFLQGRSRCPNSWTSLRSKSLKRLTTAMLNTMKSWRSTSLSHWLLADLSPLFSHLCPCRCSVLCWVSTFSLWLCMVIQCTRLSKWQNSETFGLLCSYCSALASERQPISRSCTSAVEVKT